MAKEDPEAPWSKQTLPKGHPKRGEWTISGKPSNDLAVKSLKKKSKKA